MNIPLDVVLNVGALIAAVLVLAVTMKVVLNGQGKDITEIKDGMKTLLAKDAEQDVDIAELKTEQKAHKGWVERLEKWLVRLDERRSE